MKPTKLTEVLSQLGHAELKKFRKFVHSPYFHQHKDTITFFEALAKYHPHYHEEHVSIEAIYQEVFPGLEYEDNKARTLRKYLLKLLLSFMSVDLFMNTPHEVEKYQTKSFLEKSISKFVRKSLESQKKAITHTIREGSQLFNELYLLESNSFQFSIQYENRWETSSALATLIRLDHFFILEKLIYGCAFYTYGSIFKIDPSDLFLIQEVVAHCVSNIRTLPDIIQAYTLAFQLVKDEGNPTDLDDLSQIVRANQETFDKQDIINIYVIMLNHCSLSYRKGNTAALAKMFQLYKEVITCGLLSDNYPNLHHHFKNIVTLGLKLKDYQWTDTFIEEWIHTMAEDTRADIYHYSRANLYTHTRQYAKALQELQKATFIDPFYRIGYYTLLFKIHFEKNEEEALLALINTYRTYLRRRSILTEERKLPYKEFIRLGKDIFQAKQEEPSNRNSLSQQIKEEIQSTSSLVEKEWLLEKLEGIH
ncbi:MAG: hypothetical protein AAF824_18380 [Bacteroidota bacterium]